MYAVHGRTRVLARIGQWCQTSGDLTLSGVLLGCSLASVLTQWIASSGTALPMSLWAACAILLGGTLATSLPVSRRGHATLEGGVTTGLGSLLVWVAPWLWQACLAGVPQWGAASWFMAGILTLTLPLGCLLRAIVNWKSEQPATNQAASWGLVAISAVCGMLLCGWLGLWWVGSVVAVCGLSHGLWRIWKDQSLPKSAVAFEAISTAQRAEWCSSLFVCGMGCLSTGSLLATLLPVTTYFLMLTGAGLFCGIAWGLRGRQTGTALSACCAAGVLLCGLWAYTWLISPLITISAQVSWVIGQHLFRGLFLAVCLWPWGVWCGRLIRRSSPSSAYIASGWVCFSVGSLATWWSLSVLPWTLMAALCASGTLLLACVDVVRSRAYVMNWRRRFLTATGLTACIIALVSGDRYQPEQAAKLLYSTNVFVHDRLGTPRWLLGQLDESRLISQQMTDQGLSTAWKLATSRVQLRVNGIPAGTLTLNPVICPQHSAEVLPVTLALALHQDPQNVALLGLGSSVSWQTALSSPLQHVTVIDPDARWRNWLQSLTAHSNIAALWKDERTTWIERDPCVWAGTSTTTYDVIVSDPPRAFLLSGLAHFTQEYYQRLQGRLGTEGIFCQRFQTIDFGPQALLDIQTTLKSVFEHVIAVEMGPGELALLATNSSAGLVRPGLVERLQASHVRDQLAELNWDWSVLLTLPAYSQEEFAAVQTPQPGQLVTAANGRWATQLPNELMRWAPKQQEFHTRFAQHHGRLLNWLGEAAQSDELLQRLEEVQGQQRLMADYNERYWGYRSQVKRQISRRPLSPLQRIKHERGSEGAGLPLEDKRRLLYFQQIGTALKSADPAEVRKLSHYETPFDPLISYFLHQEAAEIYRKLGRPDPQAELAHRLHSLYYSTVQDRSLQNLLATLRLVLETPEVVSTDVERWDTINSLMSLLQSRWEARSKAEPGVAHEVLRDVDASSVLVEKAILTLRELAPKVGVSVTEFEARKAVLEMQLVRPLRQYHTQLQPHVLKQKMDTDEALKYGELPSDEDLEVLDAQ